MSLPHLSSTEKSDTRQCESFWVLDDALDELKRLADADQLLLEECLPYKPDPSNRLSQEKLCERKCEKVHPNASKVCWMWQLGVGGLVGGRPLGKPPPPGVLGVVEILIHGNRWHPGVCGMEEWEQSVCQGV